MAEDTGSTSEKLAFVLIGAGIGAALALLFAPKSGRELRGDIADVTRRGIDVAGDGLRRASEAAGEYYEEGTAKAETLYKSAREKVTQGAEAVSGAATKQKGQIAAAIEAGKQAYYEEKRKGGEPGRGTVEGEG